MDNYAHQRQPGKQHGIRLGLRYRGYLQGNELSKLCVIEVVVRHENQGFHTVDFRAEGNAFDVVERKQYPQGASGDSLADRNLLARHVRRRLWAAQ